MRLSDLKARIETIIRKRGNLEVVALTSKGTVDTFTMAGFTNPETGQDLVLVVSNTDRDEMEAQKEVADGEV